MARIDDLLYVDDLSKHSDQVLSISKAAHKSVGIHCTVPILSTPCKTAFTTPSFSPAQLVSPPKGEKLPYLDNSKIPPGGFGVKKVLTDYLPIDTRGKDSNVKVERSKSSSSIIREASSSVT